MLPVLLAVLGLAIGYECPLNTKFQSVLASSIQLPNLDAY